MAPKTTAAALSDTRKACRILTATRKDFHVSEKEDGGDVDVRYYKALQLQKCQQDVKVKAEAARSNIKLVWDNGVR